MSDDQFYSQFRRYIGDFDQTNVEDFTVEGYLDDATLEATSAHITPDDTVVADFASLNPKYKPEVVVLAAINWWWNIAAGLSSKLTTTIGQASQQASDRWTHAMQMIENLQTLYQQISVLGSNIDMGNLSRWDRWTLQRYGGQREEDALNDFKSG